MTAKKIAMGVAISEIPLMAVLAYGQLHGDHNFLFTCVEIYHWIPAYILYAVSIWFNFRHVSALFSYVFLFSMQTAIVTGFLVALQRLYAKVLRR